MSRILVTGAAGFIGANFVRYTLAHTPHRVTGLDSLTDVANIGSLSGLDRARFRLVRGDVRDQLLMDELAAAHDTIVHFAAESHNDTSLENPELFLETNVIGSYRLLTAAARHGVRYHHVSTDEVYGPLDAGERPTHEGSRYSPSSPYSATKAASDMLVLGWIGSMGLDGTISHCTNNYGPFQHVEKFVPRTITNVLSGRRPRLYGDGRNVRDWIHVEDHCSALWAILDRAEPGSVYDIGAGAERSNADIVATILRILGKPADYVEHVADRPAHDYRYATDASAIRRDLGWEPSHRDLAAGLRDTVNWYALDRQWWAGAKMETEKTYALRGR